MAFKINGTNTDTMNIKFIRGTADELAKQPQFKPRFSYDWADEDGVEYDKDETLHKQQLQYTIPMYAASKSAFDSLMAIVRDADGFVLEHDSTEFMLYYVDVTNIRIYNGGKMLFNLVCLNNWETPPTT